MAADRPDGGGGPASPPIQSTIRHALAWLLTIEAAVASLAFAGVAALILFDVLGREFFNKGLFGAQKYAVYATVVAGFLGLVLATATGRHLKAEVARPLTPPGWDAVVERLSDLVSAAMFIVLGVVALIYVSETFAADERAAVLYIPIWPMQLVLPYAFFSCALRHLVFAAFPALRPDGNAETGGGM